MNADPNGPESVVQRQLDAYNARNLEALLAIYADDAELYDHPETLLARGSEALRLRFGARFREPNLRATLVGRVVLGQFVVDHERVRRTFPEGPGEIELVMTYEVRDGRIRRAWNLAGPKRFDPAPPQTPP